ncbi:EF-Tu/IF-2/RF-3 family GTPase [Verrucomicrobiota bacterium]
MPEQEIGKIEHFFDQINVAALTITKGKLSVGDTIHIKGHTTDVTTTIESMQIEHGKVDKVKKGDSVGIKVPDKVREHDKVFKVTE